MGIGIGSRCRVYPKECQCNCCQNKTENKTVYPPNPNPARFEIIQTQEIGRHVVAVIKYPDCTNFGGMKVLVYLNVTPDQLKVATRLDPHFAEDNTLLSPTARFKPNKFGWENACRFAESID